MLLLNKMETPNDSEYVWESCCFRLDTRCVVFIVQTLIGFTLLAFCAYELSTEQECDRAAPYWGLIGTVAGFFFNKLSVNYYGTNQDGPQDGPAIRSPQPRTRVRAVSIHE